MRMRPWGPGPERACVLTRSRFHTPIGIYVVAQTRPNTSPSLRRPTLRHRVPPGRRCFAPIPPSPSSRALAGPTCTMTTAGEAAALFGAPDTALDPFAAALDGHDSRDHPNGDPVASDAAADLFGSADDPFPVGENSEGSVLQSEPQQAWYDTAGQQTYAYGTAAASTYTATYAEQPRTQQNGAYAAYSQYSSYAPAPAPAPAPTASAYEPAYAQQQAYTPQQSYVPQTYTSYGQNDSLYVPASSAQQASVTQASAYSTSTYDPYKPAQTTSTYDPPSVNPTSPAQPSYDPYKPSYAPAPSAYEPASQQTSYAPSSHTTAHVSPSVTVPPPPAPIVEAPPAPPAVTVAPYRPKTSNAYDPPLPPLKASKHVHIPPRPTYNTPPPMSPSGSTYAAQPLQLPPAGPPKSPNPYASPPPARRDSHPPAHAQAPQAQSGPYAPSLPNGTHEPSPYAQPYNATPNGAAYGTSGQYGGSPAASYSHAAPAVPVSPPQPNRAPAFSPPPIANGAEVVGPHVAEPGLSEPIFSSEIVGSPAHGGVFDPEDGTPQASQQGFADDEATPSLPPSSPPRTVRSPVSPGTSWPNGTGQSSPRRHGPSSPGRSKSPKKPSSIASTSPPPHYGRNQASDSYAPTSKPASINSVSPPPSAQPATYPSDPYAPPPKAEASDRAKSPGASSIRSVQSGLVQGHGLPPRKGSASAFVSPLNRPLSSQSRRSTLSNSYEPQYVPDSVRAASPAGSIRSVAAPKQGAYDPYAPSEKPATASVPHARSPSNGSTYSSVSAADPYAPSRYPARQSSEHTYSSFSLPTQNNSYAPSSTSYDRLGGQVVTLAAPVHSSYAPSPSLLGTNDPLGRTSAKVPVVSFGFGGKLVTCFHGASMSTGFDVALSARQSTDIKIHALNKVIPESALDSSAASYPGPLFSDPGTPTTSLVRTGATQLKTKKARVVKYLEERAEEIKSGLGYHRAGSADQGRAEAKRVLVLLLKAMVENDGRLSGSTEIDAATRAALLPDMDSAAIHVDASHGTSGIASASSSDLLAGAQYGLTSALPSAQDHTVSTTIVRSSQLDKIQSLLAKGDRRGACHYAADEKLWPHAFVIASSIDKETWKDVVTEWARAELANDHTDGAPTGGRESLRVAYSLFGGNGASAIQELVSPSSLLQQQQTQALQIPQPPQLSLTPMTPNFPAVQPLNIPQDVLGNWAQTAAMILSNPLTPDVSSALTALGDQLFAHQWVEAAHACYLLSPQTSPLGGMGNHPRLTLLGGGSASTSPIYFKDPDPIVFSEIAEFAMSLASPSKGQEAFSGLPHLQPYRLLRAVCLAEIGHVQLANRYCEAISACLSRSQYWNMTFVEQLKGLSDRLTAAPQLDKTGSWIPGKMAKPSLDSIGNWLEGRFTKFIAGEGDSPHPEESKSLAQQQTYSGPFANYSSISSATTSAQPSPHQSVTDLTEVSTVAPPFRAGSAMGGRPPSRSQMPINRASSAMDYVRPFQRTGSPIARVASANAATFADAASYGQTRGPYGNGYVPSQGSDYLKPEGGSHGDVSGYGHSKGPSTGLWGASDSDAATPTASTFSHMDNQPSSSTSNSGFISLMDDPMLSMTPTATKQQGSPLPRSSSYTIEEDEDDDLGLGNSSSRSKKPENQGNGDVIGDEVKQEEKPKPAEPPKPEVKQTASSGWLSRLWKRSEPTTPAPVKANLGEESSFYYDKELKRWVNKNSSAETVKAAPPPPPPRAQTASPGRSFGAMPPPSPLGPPPARPATAHPIDLTAEPPRRAPPRVRSNLVPSDAEGVPTPPSPLPPPSASGTPPPLGAGPPPAGRPKSAMKRNVRSRYVDVFQQEASAGGS
ncbi:Sec23-binding domain of Sec16-domain-containing protein [Trametes maxima]|nr:Sec23-binding domain of Sec16-domain-containing protein [Trametes maxima]